MWKNEFLRMLYLNVYAYIGTIFAAVKPKHLTNMKNFTHKIAVLAMTMLATTAVSAQYITEAPAGGFDMNNGKDYVIIYTPQAQVEAMGDKILSNQNLDPEMEKNQFYYWTADWDKTLFTLYDIEDTQKNSWGGDDKLNMTPLFAWGSGNFSAKSQNYDLSAVTDDHVLHIGFMNIGAETATKQFHFQLGPSANNSFMLQANTPVGQAAGDYVGVGAATDVNKWYYLDIPVKDLVDPDGNFGYEYDFSTPYKGDAFVVGFTSATVSTYTAGAVDPETGMKRITITKKGSALALDAVYLYVPDESAGVDNIVMDNDGKDANSWYSIDGKRMNAKPSTKGLYIHNGKKYVVK